MAFLDGSVVNIAIPTIQTKLQTDLSGIQWVVNSYTIALSSLILLGGALGDHFGRKRIFSLGIVIFTISSFLCSTSQTIGQLIAFRGLQGLGAALMVPGSLSIINTSFEERSRGAAIGLWSGFSGGVAALGPFLGGVLVQTLGWPSIFYINIPLGVLAFLVSLKFVPEGKSARSSKLDFVGALLIFLSLLGVAFGLIYEPNLGLHNPIVWSSLVVGVVLFSLFVSYQKKSPHPLVPLQIFKSPLVVGANLATLCLYFALAGVVFFLILNFQQVQHYSPIYSGMGMLPTILLITFLSGWGGKLADRIGPRLPMILGPAIVGVGMSLFILPNRGANYFVSFLPGLVLFGGGMSMVIAPLTKSALSVKADFSGAASGVNNAVARVAGLLAVAFLGALLAFFFSTTLSTKLNQTALSPNQKQQILAQRNRLMAISLPNSITPNTKLALQQDLEESFLAGFKVIMGVNAFLAYLASAIAFLTIKPNKSPD